MYKCGSGLKLFNGLNFEVILNLLNVAILLLIVQILLVSRIQQKFLAVFIVKLFQLGGLGVQGYY